MLISVKKINKTIGKNICDLRGAKELTQEELAHMTGISRISVINIEKGRQGLTMMNLLNIAEALEVPVTKLVEGLD